METAAVDPHRIDAIVFDVIGTLVDEEGTWADIAPRLSAAAGVDASADLLGAWGELLQRSMDAVVAGTAPWRPHQELVTASARDAITQAGGNPSPGALDLVRSLDREYPAWPDVAPATAALRRNRLVAGVSNADLDCLARLANTNAISWDAALSTGTARTFKPDPAVYRYAIDALHLDAARTLFVAAHPWDLRAAAEHGFRTAYVGRPGAERPSPDDRFDLAVDDLTVLAGILRSPAADLG